MPSLTEDLQSQIRSIIGTYYTFTGDMRGFFDFKGIAAGQFNERLIEYVNALDATIKTSSVALNYALLNPLIFATSGQNISLLQGGYLFTLQGDPITTL